MERRDFTEQGGTGHRLVYHIRTFVFLIFPPIPTPLGVQRYKQEVL